MKKHFWFWFMSVFFSSSYSFQSMASDFDVQAESFLTIFDNSLSMFKLKAVDFANGNLFRDYKTHMTFEFPAGTKPGSCGYSTQALELKTMSSVNSMKQSFVFTDCNKHSETLTITRRGIGLKPISLSEFMKGAWALPVELGGWDLETSWNRLKISTEKTKERQETRIFLEYNWSDLSSHTLEFKLKEINKVEGSSQILRREYGVREDSGGTFFTYVVQRERRGSIFLEERYFLGEQEIDGRDFSTEYQQLISGALVQLVGMILRNLPVK